MQKLFYLFIFVFIVSSVFVYADDEESLELVTFEFSYQSQYRDENGEVQNTSLSDSQIVFSETKEELESLTEVEGSRTTEELSQSTRDTSGPRVLSDVVYSTVNRGQSSSAHGDDEYVYDNYTDYHREYREFSTETTHNMRDTFDMADVDAFQVDVTVKLTDMLNVASTQQTDDDGNINWFASWEIASNVSEGTQKEVTFHVKSDTVETVTEAVNNLNGLYDDLFALQEEIFQLEQEIDAFLTSPNQDKQHSSKMAKLARLRKKEYNLKVEITNTRATIYGEDAQKHLEGNSNELGWNVSTYIYEDTEDYKEYTQSVRHDTNTYTANRQVLNHINYGAFSDCFVGDTSIDNVTLAELWKNKKQVALVKNNAKTLQKVFRTGRYKGTVYMFYAENGKALLPGFVTENHMLALGGKVSKKASEVKVADSIVLSNNEVVKVVKVETKEYDGHVYNFSTNKTCYSFPNYAKTYGF